MVGGLFSFVGDAVDWATHGGNRPGTPESRALGADPNAVADSIVAQIRAAPQTSAANGRGQLLLAGIGAAAFILLLSGKRRR